MSHLKTPWSSEAVKALNELQTGKRMGHAYTCLNRGDGNHHDNGNDLGCLVATENGWMCPDCDYTQDWAHTSSLNLPPVDDNLIGRIFYQAEFLTKAAVVLGTPELAKEWLDKPARGLDGRKPVELLNTEAGREELSAFLQRMEHGVY